MATEAQTLTGCVKWFNNGLNYGFITVLSDGEYRNTDVFVHQANIRTSRDCFRTLYTGECVQFELAKSDNEKHPFHAVNVNGFNGAQLRCEVPRGFGRSSGRGRGGGGGSARGRGGIRRNQSRDSAAGTQNSGSVETATTGTQNVETATTPASTTVPETEPEPVAAATPVAKGRGRGRGRKVSA